MHAHTPSAWKRPLIGAAVAVLGVALVVLAVIARPTAHRRPVRPNPPPAARTAARPAARRPATRATVTLAGSGATVAIPRSFLGFSTEYWTLPVDENHIALYERVISLLHVRGDARFVLRIGGVSSDHSFWQLAMHRVPAWAFAVTPRWIMKTARIVRQSRLRVIIDLNLVTATPALDAALAREAIGELPRGSIAAFEIGNEPDVYNRHVWGFRLEGDRVAIGLLPRSLTARTYATSFRAAARSLATVAPRIPLQGPALADPRLNRSWIARLLVTRHSHLDAISVHQYPYTECARPGAAAYPTIGKLLSTRASSAMAAAVRPAVRLAGRHAIPVRVSEFNSVTCGGVAGVSNSFATALWAPSALFALIRAGVSSADLHVRAYSVNSPFGFDRRGIVPRPLLYGLILFTRMLAPGARVAVVHVHAPAGADLHAWAVRQPRRRVSVLLIDRAQRPVQVDVRLPSQRSATVQRLLAPSARSTSGETFDGQSMGADGRWKGRRRVQTVALRRGHFTITVPGVSAAVVTASLTGRR